MRPVLIAGVFALVLGLAGCASAGAGARAPNDPLEPLNRAVFAFNEAVDDAVLAPAARAYVDTVPEVFRVAIGNFFGNLRDLWTAANQLLQGKPVEAVGDLTRFALNSTVGFVGIADVATELGFERRREDFGQTLGRWGVGTGPYLVLPLFGPSNLRDGLGLTLDLSADPLPAGVEAVPVRNGLRVLRVVDDRSGYLRAGRVLEGAALDKYTFVRDGYLQRRRNQIWDGDPPPEPEDDPRGDASSPGKGG